MNLVQYNEYIVSTIYTDGLVLKHQGINNYNNYNFAWQTNTFVEKTLIYFMWMCK